MMRSKAAFTEAQLDRAIRRLEGSTSRTALDKTAIRVNQIEKMLSKGGRFGVLSAYGPGSKSENKARHGELVRDLQMAGYRFHDFRGSWEGVAEKSLLVPDMDWKDLLRLGRKYDQISLIYKSKDGVLGMYYPKKGYAEVAVDVNTLSPSAQVSMKEDLYSKGRGVSFEFNFAWEKFVPWDGRTPLQAREVSQLVEKGFFSPAP